MLNIFVLVSDYILPYISKTVNNSNDYYLSFLDFPGSAAYLLDEMPGKSGWKQSESISRHNVYNSMAENAEIYN